MERMVQITFAMRLSPNTSARATEALIEDFQENPLLPGLPRHRCHDSKAIFCSFRLPTRASHLCRLCTSQDPPRLGLGFQFYLEYKNQKNNGRTTPHPYTTKTPTYLGDLLEFLLSIRAVLVLVRMVLFRQLEVLFLDLPKQSRKNAFQV